MLGSFIHLKKKSKIQFSDSSCFILRSTALKGVKAGFSRYYLAKKCVPPLLVSALVVSDDLDQESARPPLLGRVGIIRSDLYLVMEHPFEIVSRIHRGMVTGQPWLRWHVQNDRRLRIWVSGALSWPVINRHFSMNLGRFLRILSIWSLL